MTREKVILAYSGGLDTSVAIKWLMKEYNFDVVSLIIDVGQKENLEAIKEKALRIGAVDSICIDAKLSFVKEYLFPALKANAVYEDQYPLSTALSRPLIAKLIVDMAHKKGATTVTHGCTGKGNDQVRFDVSISALAPELKIVAPAREWGLSRDEVMEYAKTNGIPVDVGIQNPYSIDQNIWGRSIECGVLEDPWIEPPEEVYEFTVSPESCPAQPTYLEIEFKQGIPEKINGENLSPVELVEKLNQIGGTNGVGRIDHIENRLVGIKSREIYECPAAQLLITAHKSLESLVLIREMLHYKKLVEEKYSELVYYGRWFSPLRKAIDAFIESTQENVTGKARLKLYKGNCSIVGRESSFSLYEHELATYDKSDTFDHKAAEGFIKLWGLDLKTYAGRFQDES